jgi:26S proteasome regulatory subunit N2
MHSGTTSDVFLRENLEWLGLASNWSKFSATAGLGVIHKGYFEEGMTILGPYLPQANGESQMAGAAYSEGGALYALGLINAGCGSGRSVEGYLRGALKAAQSEIVQHGAALGLGVSGMGGRNTETYDDLKQTLFTDSAVAGEAAGYAMGLVMLGTADMTSTDEMFTYARETQHEKIIRGLAVGIAFIYYGKQEQADAIIKQLLAEKVGRNFLDASYRTNLTCCRILFCGTVEYIRWHWRTPEPQITTQSDNSFISPSLIHHTMFDGRP